jgi:hypothetical protein
MTTDTAATPSSQLFNRLLQPTQHLLQQMQGALDAKLLIAAAPVHASDKHQRCIGHPMQGSVRQ